MALHLKIPTIFAIRSVFLFGEQDGSQNSSIVSLLLGAAHSAQINMRCPSSLFNPDYNYTLTNLLYFDKVYVMSNDKTTIWKNDTARQLAEALTAIDSITDMQNFLRDVMTEKEITEISSRFKAAQMLTEGKKYTEIVAQTKLSSRTVARISDWLQNGCSGYQAALNTVSHHHSHILPASAD